VKLLFSLQAVFAVCTA